MKKSVKLLLALLMFVPFLASAEESGMEGDGGAAAHQSEENKAAPEHKKHKKHKHNNKKEKAGKSEAEEHGSKE